MADAAGESIEMPLSEVLEAIHRDLTESAEKRPEDWEPIFEIESAEVELRVNIKHETGENAGIKLYVLSLGAKNAVAEEFSHRITLRLGAVQRDKEGQDKGPTAPFRGERKNPRLRGTEESES